MIEIFTEGKDHKATSIHGEWLLLGSIRLSMKLGMDVIKINFEAAQ
jgi:hypothetical protein